MTRVPRTSIAFLVVLLSLAFGVVPASASCFPPQLFASIGNQAQGEIQVKVDVSLTDDGGNEIGRFWVADNSIDGNSFAGTGNCPSSGWWISTPSGDRGIRGTITDASCDVTNCPSPSNDEMIFVVEEWGPSGPPGLWDTAHFIAFRVDGNSGSIRDWNLGRVASEDTVLPMPEFPKPDVLSSSAAGEGLVQLTIQYADVVSNVHTPVDDSLPASSVVKSYDLHQFVGPPAGSEPGRLAEAWTLIDQIPYQDGSTIDEVIVPCLPTGANVYLAVGLTFRGGAGPDVKSELVGRAISVECGINPITNPAGGVPDGHDILGEPLRLQKMIGSEELLLTATWGTSCFASDVSYALHEGVLGDFAHRTPVTCSTGSALTYDFAPSGADSYYLVVPVSPFDVQFGVFPAEGSYGLTSSGEERPQDYLTGCLPQHIASCN